MGVKGFVILILAVSFVMGVSAKGKTESDKGKVVVLSAKSYESEVASGLVLVDFWAAWCGPCRRLEPVLKSLVVDNDLKVGKLNVDNYKAFVRGKGVSKLPTLLLYKDGKEVERLTGLYSKEELQEILNKYK